MKRVLPKVLSLLIGMCPMTSAAYSSVCSDPSRARVLARATVILPSDNIAPLERRFTIIAPKLGMMVWGVGSEEHGKILSKTLGMQSPKVSVSIEADWKPGMRAATLVAERTCYTDDLEPWRRYWSGLIHQLKSSGYRVVPSR